MKRVLQFVAFISIFGVILISCSKYHGYEESESGVLYKFHVKNDGAKIKAGDEASFHLRYSIDDSVIFDTKNSPYNNKQVILESQCSGDIYECLTGMSVGDSATFIINADSFYLVTAGYQTLPKNLKPESKLRAEVKILTVKLKEEIEIEKRRMLAEFKAQEPEKIAHLKQKYKTDKEFIEGTGILYKEIEKGKGRSVKESDYISVDYVLRDSKMNVIFRSTRIGEKVAFECGGENFETEGFNMVICKMRKGQKAHFVIPSKYGFGEDGIKSKLKPNSPVLYTIEVVDLHTKEEFLAKKKEQTDKLVKEENNLLAKYISENNITTEARESGLIYIEKAAGAGVKAQNGDKVSVHYTVYNLNGDKIDSSLDRNQPFTFTVGRNEVINGWDEALTLMNEGTKATIIVPSKIAYKDKKKSPKIPPYTPLRFEMELVRIFK